MACCSALAELVHPAAERGDGGIGRPELAGELVEVLGLGARERAERSPHVDAAVGGVYGSVGCKSVLGEPAREVAACDLSGRPPERGCVAVGAAAQAAAA